MKKLIFISTFLLMSIEMYGQSDSANLVVSFKKNLENMPKGFTFLKSYPVALYYRKIKPWYEIGKPLFLTQNLQENSSNFIFAKNTRLKKNIEYTLVLSKGNTYWIGISEKDNSKGIVGVLYDIDRQDLTTNYVNNTFFKGYYFKCNRTGIYYLNFKFQDSETYCGAAILALKTKHDEK